MSRIELADFIGGLLVKGQNDIDEIVFLANQQSLGESASLCVSKFLEYYKVSEDLYRSFVYAFFTEI